MELHLTQTERMLYDAMADGEAHRIPELLELFQDELTDKSTLQVHIHNLRNKLQANGETIMAQSFGHGSGYRRIQLITRDAILAKKEAERNE